MEQLSLNDTVTWEPETKKCTLCDHADDAGSAMAFLKQMDTAQGGRSTDARLALEMMESYETFFLEPMVKAGMNPPTLTEAEITLHFTAHDINPMRQLRIDIRNINTMQDALVGRVMSDESSSKHWAHLQRLKMDALKEYGICDRTRSREMPTLGL